MSVTAVVVRKGAEERVPFFSDKVIGLSVALRMLGDLQRELLADLAAVDPGFLATTVTVVGLGAGTAITAEHVLPEHTHILDVTAVGPGDLVTPVMRLTPAYAGVLAPRLAYYEVNRGLRLIGVESDWSGLTQLNVRLGLATNAALYPTADASVLFVPEQATGVMIAQLAVAFADRMFLSGTLGDLDAAPFITRLEKIADKAHQRLLDQVGKRGQGGVMPVMETW